MTEFEASLHALREGRLTFPQFSRDVAPVLRRFAAYLCRRWRPPLGVDEADVEQELALAAWWAVDRWDPSRGTTLDAFVRFNAIDKAKKWLHKQRNSKRRDGSAPSRVPTVFSAFERPDEEAGAAQDRFAWVPAEGQEVALAMRDMRRELDRAFAEVAPRMPYRERECLPYLALAGGSVDDAAFMITMDPAARLALRIGSDDEAVHVVRRAAGRAIELMTANGGA